MDKGKLFVYNSETYLTNARYVTEKNNYGIDRVCNGRSFNGSSKSF